MKYLKSHKKLLYILESNPLPPEEALLKFATDT